MQARAEVSKETNHALDNDFGFFCDFFPEDEAC